MNKTSLYFIYMFIKCNKIVIEIIGLFVDLENSRKFYKRGDFLKTEETGEDIVFDI